MFSTSGWEKQFLSLGPGVQTVTRTLSSLMYFSAPSTGYVDQVTFTPGVTKPAVSFLTSDTYVRANAPIRFDVSAYGTGPLSYQWQMDGTNLSHQNRSLLEMFGVQPKDSGVYSVIITNAYGSITTNVSLWVGRFALNTRSSEFRATNGFRLNLDGILTTNPVVILGSTDRVNWLPLFTNPPTTGSLQFIDVKATNLPARFYRARE